MVTKTKEMIEVIIPHFERYPLRSKKARDFIAWRPGVEWLWLVQCRFRRRNPGQRGGRASAWTHAERAEFRSVMESLRAGRRKEPGDDRVIPPEPTAIEKQGDLFTC
jgi:hypothetical protein